MALILGNSLKLPTVFTANVVTEITCNYCIYPSRLLFTTGLNYLVVLSSLHRSSERLQTVCLNSRNVYVLI